MNILRFLKPKSEVNFLYDDCTLRQGLEKMRFHGHHAIPVISREGQYVGTVSEGDFLWHMYDRGETDPHSQEEHTIREILSPKENPPVLNSVPISELLQRVKVNGFVPVIDDRGCFIGIITRREVINYYVDHFVLDE